jgi:hypothetical protein
VTAVRGCGQQGSVSSGLLLVSWLALMGFLGLGFDYALAMVYREQLRTAVEAAVTAGAMKARYYLTVQLHRERWRAVRDCEEVTDEEGETFIVCDPPRWEKEEAGSVRVGPRFEDEIWWPHQKWPGRDSPPQPLWGVFPQECHPPRPPAAEGDWRWHCLYAAVQPGDCLVMEWEPNAAVDAARTAYRMNQVRWQGAMADTPGDPVVTGRWMQPVEKFEVTMTARATLRTRFMRYLGFVELPIVADTASGEPIKARLVRKGAIPPNCPRQG